MENFPCCHKRRVDRETANYCSHIVVAVGTILHFVRLLTAWMHMKSFLTMLFGFKFVSNSFISSSAAIFVYSSNDRIELFMHTWVTQNTNIQRHLNMIAASESIELEEIEKSINSKLERNLNFNTKYLHVPSTSHFFRHIISFCLFIHISEWEATRKGSVSDKKCFGKQQTWNLWWNCVMRAAKCQL